MSLAWLRSLCTSAACISMFVLAQLSWAEGMTAGKSLSLPEKLRLGERMYREGILPSGEPMQAIVKGDLPVPGTAFTCVSCHLRGGIGSVEGGVYTPPTNGKSLYQPLKKYYKGVEVKYGESPFRRPAYTDKTLADLLGGGVDPTGKVMHDVMPRYVLDDADMDLLILYLKNLSTEFSPGVSDTTLRFATIISADANPDDVALMIKGLEKYFSGKNSMAANYRTIRNPRDQMMTRAMSTSKMLENRTFVLDRWLLKGKPETWRSQLEEYNRKEPPFVLLGGLINGDWEPIHRFSEENRIPCLFPNTEFPVISETDWYTLYLSKGYYLEGESTARFLNDKLTEGQNAPVVQIIRDSREGRALAAGFTEAWKMLGRKAPITVSIAAGESLSSAGVAQSTSGKKPAAVVLWDGPMAVAALQDLSTAPFRPEMVFVSSSYLGKELWKLPEQVRDFTYLAYPFRLPQDKVFEPMMGGEITFQVENNRVAQQTYALVQVLTMAVMEIKDNYYRDHFLDAIGMSMDLVVPLYERLSFGPGQRYASKGCYIVQLSKDPKPALVKKSDWVIH